MEWVGIPFSRGSSWPWGQTWASWIARILFFFFFFFFREMHFFSIIFFIFFCPHCAACRILSFPSRDRIYASCSGSADRILTTGPPGKSPSRFFIIWNTREALYIHDSTLKNKNKTKKKTPDAQYFFFSNYDILDLQYCVSFWYKMKWISYMYTWYILFLLDLPLTTPLHPVTKSKLTACHTNGK